MLQIYVDSTGRVTCTTQRDSSPLFSVMIVHLANPTEANACQSALAVLRTQLSLSPHNEFHFAKDNHLIIQKTLRVIAQHNFQYSSFVINKRAIVREKHPDMRHKHAIYQFACRSALYPLRDHLHQTILIMDECGGATFTNEMGFIRLFGGLPRERDGILRHGSDVQWLP